MILDSGLLFGPPCRFDWLRLGRLLQVVAKGFVLGRHSYLRSGWNVMDGILVFVSLVDIVISLSARQSPKIFGVLRVFRLLRTLRPLRSVSELTFFCECTRFRVDSCCYRIKLVRFGPSRSIAFSFKFLRRLSGAHLLRLSSEATHCFQY